MRPSAFYEIADCARGYGFAWFHLRSAWCKDRTLASARLAHWRVKMECAIALYKLTQKRRVS